MEGFAIIEKTELLALFKIADTKFSELILRDIKPFPGYYSETPGVTDVDVPNYAFIAMKYGEACFDDIVMRAQYAIREKVDYKFEINFGRISILNRLQPCVRVAIDDFNNMSDLLIKLKNYGIEFEKTYDVKPFDSHIKIRKFIDLEEYSKDVYVEKENNFNDAYYLKISKKLHWDDFVKLIISVRGTGKFNNFDAAMLSMYRKKGISEFVRVYTKSFSKNDFIEFKDELNRQILHLN